MTEEQRDLVKFLTTDGQRGSCLDWYGELRLARYLCVAPWELPNVPREWMERAQQALEVEQRAHELVMSRGVPKLGAEGL